MPVFTSVPDALDFVRSNNPQSALIIFDEGDGPRVQLVGVNTTDHFRDGVMAVLMKWFESDKRYDEPTMPRAERRRRARGRT